MTMPSSATLAAFWIATLALYLAPGPDMIYVASQAIGRGRRAGVFSALGIFTGLLVHMLAASLGLAAVLVAAPLAFEVIRWAGVAYLAWLGIRMLRSKDDGFEMQRTAGRAAPLAIARQGFVTNLLNPKIGLFFLAFLPQFTHPANGPLWAQMLLFGAMFNAGGLIWLLLQAMVFGQLGRWLSRHPGVWVWQRRVTGSTLLGLAAWLALEGRR